MIDYYKRLHIDSDSSKDEIKKAFRNLSKKYHPDLNKDNKEFEELFKEIQEAYSTLSNSSKKQEYDYKLKNYRLKKSQVKRAGKSIPHVRHSNLQMRKPEAVKINPFFVTGGIIFLLIVTISISYLESRLDESVGAIHALDTASEKQTLDSLHLIEGFRPLTPDYRANKNKDGLEKKSDK